MIINVNVKNASVFDKKIRSYILQAGWRSITIKIWF